MGNALGNLVTHFVAAVKSALAGVLNVFFNQPVGDFGVATIETLQQIHGWSHFVHHVLDKVPLSDDVPGLSQAKSFSHAIDDATTQAEQQIKADVKNITAGGDRLLLFLLVAAAGVAAYVFT